MRFGRRLTTFAFLNLGHAYDHLFMLLYPTVVLALGDVFQASYGELLALSVYGFIAFGAGALPAGWLGDRWSRRGMMIVFFVGIGLASILTGLARSTVDIAVGLALIGLFASIYHPVGIAMVAETDPARVGKALGVNGVFGNLGVAFAGVTAGALTDMISWRAAFIIPGVV
ncbi:MAG: MFS transporter, partial [Proteobacteria bacterium]|nr:MFS transporter [Pseudomonadota bacterium]